MSRISKIEKQIGIDLMSLWVGLALLCLGGLATLVFWLNGLSVGKGISYGVMMAGGIITAIWLLIACILSISVRGKISKR